MSPRYAPDDIDESFVPVPRSTVATAELDGEAVIFSEETQNMHVLNPTATIVWACFDGSEGQLLHRGHRP